MNNYKSSIIEHFGNLKDIRQEGKIRHKLIDIVFIAVVGTICTADTWENIELFAREREEWFKKYLELPNGIPSHDTMERIFHNINPKQFEKCFISWMECITERTKGSIIAIDGKTMRGTGDKRKDKNPIHVVSAWADDIKMVLGQVKTEVKSNEITAIPELLELLEIKGSIVTIDAMGTQKKIAKTIIDKKADYVLALKGNQQNLHADVEDYFDGMLNAKVKDYEYDYFSKSEKDHGRIEKRKCYVVTDLEWLDWKKDWEGLKSIGLVIRECEENGAKSVEKRYFISSLKVSAESFLQAVRSHWGVESMHWSLDVTFREDSCRVRKDYAPQNLAVLKRIALNYVKKDKESKQSLGRRRFKASLNTTYLEKLVFGD